MRSVAALLAAALAAAGLAGCGGSGSGAEPGASRQATLVLDFTPNAVHTGIYAALAQGYYADRDVDLTVHAPSASTDAPKLLESGRAQFAILDIHDLAIADERGLRLVGVAPIVERPLAAVIAADRSQVRTPADLAGKTIGVTGLPSDDAVLDSVLRSAGLSLGDVHKVTIGFNAVTDLAAGKVDAATAFWNAEGITLRRRGIPTRVFPVDDFGAPRYPELWLTTTEREKKSDPGLVGDVVAATRDGTLFASSHPTQALDDLLAGDQALDRADQGAELRALQDAKAFTPAVELQNGSDWRNTWTGWEVANGIVASRPTFTRLFK
jgi:putative hydroxymethylpyrimidine transport system substrate-binding protein